MARDEGWAIARAKAKAQQDGYAPERLTQVHARNDLLSYRVEFADVSEHRPRSIIIVVSKLTGRARYEPLR